MAITQIPDVLEASPYMGSGADWHEPSRIQKCDKEHAWFAIRKMRDDSGRMWDGREIKTVVGGPYPTKDEAMDQARAVITG